MLTQKLIKELEIYIYNLLDMQVNEISEAKLADYLIYDEIEPEELENFIKKKRKPTLNELLFSFIDRENKTDSDIYKKASIDRRHFSKIRSNPSYRPGKNTVIALALALELPSDDVILLLSSAGHSLSDSDTADLVIQFCLEKNIYDIDAVNEALVHFNLKTLT
ncbi:hypothetical protein [Halalkalibacter akibai]|uniref:Uncharacterized protein n=1 Tax=Halalkalibacter akibai (strain ATCC 43226 / DSM 21942 / CIP 109018 / JCM 9157 / 1139) TaxID=1236973 RepID=W4QYF7_HALA3|nr:hypothetical protein [Halalkalibacter akibai]GAE37121.1 hypothetical protein JCM9157_4369 [Halalkalibacter akibai JCM 9157]